MDFCVATVLIVIAVFMLVRHFSQPGIEPTKNERMDRILPPEQRRKRT